MGLNLRRKPSQDVRNLTRAAKSQIDKTGGKSSPRNAVGSGNCLFSSSSSSPSFIEFSKRWLNTVIRDKTGLASNWSWSTHSFPTKPMKCCTTPPGSYALNSLRTALSVGSFRPSRIWTVKELWDGAYDFSSLSEMTKISNCLTICCRCYNKGSTFPSVISPAAVDWTDNMLICSSQKEKTF